MTCFNCHLTNTCFCILFKLTDIVNCIIKRKECSKIRINRSLSVRTRGLVI